MKKSWHDTITWCFLSHGLDMMTGSVEYTWETCLLGVSEMANALLGTIICMCRVMYSQLAFPRWYHFIINRLRWTDIFKSTGGVYSVCFAEKSRFCYRSVILLDNQSLQAPHAEPSPASRQAHSWIEWRWHCFFSSSVISDMSISSGDLLLGPSFSWQASWWCSIFSRDLGFFLN